MNYIEQITKYFTDKGQEEQIPFALLSAKVQGIQHWQSNYESDTYNISRTVEQLETLNVDQLLHWSATNEGHEYWYDIHHYCGGKVG